MAPSVLVIAAVVLLQCMWASAQSNGTTSNCNPTHHNAEAVSRSVEKATRLLSRFPSAVKSEDRLLVMILFSNGLHSGHHAHARLEYLKCSLQKLQANLMKHTTVDVFIWTLTHELATTDSIIPKWFTPQDFPRMNIIDIEKETWLVPCGLKHDSQWAVRAHFDLDYYLMGRWRLTFSLDFARAMGYKYHLQFDDDAILTAPIGYDLVKKMGANKIVNDFTHNNREAKAQMEAQQRKQQQKMVQQMHPPALGNRQFPNRGYNQQVQQQVYTFAAQVGSTMVNTKYNSQDAVFDVNNNITGYHMAVLDDLNGETQNVVAGLPELTAYWMKINKFNVRGPLLDHLSSKSVATGMYSAFESSDGWDRQFYPGYFMVLNVDYWFLPEVQDYLTTVFRSGRDVEGRWQEQGVMNMMNHVFVPANKLLVLGDVKVVHDRQKRATFDAWCAASPVAE